MKKNLLLLGLLLFTQIISAQQFTATGVVNASDDPYPIVGANVSIKGTSIGTITDLDGNFQLDGHKGDILVVSYIGYKVEEVVIENASPLNVTLSPDNMLLEEVVAIGYGTMKKSDLTGAVSSIKADQLKKTPAAGLDQALQGRAAGVTVNANSGQPGSAATIRIRGIGSAIGGSDPIYVVDGVIMDNIAFLNPNDISSTEILKDASATSIYGSRGANGVIIVTTRTGKQGKPSVSFDAYWGIQNRWNKLNLMGSEEMADTKLRINTMKNGASELAFYKKQGFNEWMSMYNAEQGSGYYPTVQTNKTPNGFDYSSVETDWQDAVFNPNAFMHNYNLAVEGGSDVSTYSFSTSFFEQEGTIIGSDYERFTLRLNSEYKIAKWLKFGEHVSLVSSTGRNAMNNNSSPGASVISAALAMAPWDPTHYADGTVNSQGKDLSGQIAASSNFKNVVNPFSMVQHSYPKNDAKRLVGDLYLVINPIKELTIRSTVSLDYSIAEDKLFKEAYEYSSFDKMDKNYLSSSIYRYMTLMEETTATYANDWGKHNFSAMIGQSVEQYNMYGIGGAGASILNPVETNWYLNQTTDDRTFAGDGVARVRRMSFLGRLHYGYDSRYMITANFRADGTSKFPNNPWGFFPSAAFAWRISEESFLDDAENLDNLKLRLGWGQVGNDKVNDNAFSTMMGTSADVFYGYAFGGVLQSGSSVLTYANKDGRWETNEQLNAGIDFGFWNGLFFGSVDYFRRDTKDALLYVNAPAHAGNRYELVSNVGVIRNEGVELQLGHQHKVGEVSYTIDGNVSFIKNKLAKSNGGYPLYGDRTITDEGLPLNTFWGYQYEGIYQSDAEALEQLHGETAETIAVRAGDARYTDINGDGFINDSDKTNIGNPFPWLTYGLNVGAEFYGFDVQLFFQGVFGNQIYNAVRLRTEGLGDEATLSSSMSDAWIGYTNVVRNSLEKNGINWMNLENRNGSIPNPAGSPTNAYDSSRFIESGAYLRLKNLQIGYTLPKSMTEKAYIQRCRFYLSASNLFTITNYTGYDPEISTGVDYGNYPQSRTFTLGVNLNL